MTPEASRPLVCSGSGREVEIGVEDLAVAQLHPFGGLRLLDLDDHVRLGEHVLGRPGDRGAGGAIGVVVGADAGAGAGLDQHLVAVRDIFADRRRASGRRGIRGS